MKQGLIPWCKPRFLWSICVKKFFSDLLKQIVSCFKKNVFKILTSGRMIFDLWTKDVWYVWQLHETCTVCKRKTFDRWEKDMHKRCVKCWRKMFDMCTKDVWYVYETCVMRRKSCMICKRNKYTRDVWCVHKRCLMCGRKMFDMWTKDLWYMHERCVICGRMRFDGWTIALLWYFVFVVVFCTCFDAKKKTSPQGLQEHVPISVINQPAIKM